MSSGKNKSQEKKRQVKRKMKKEVRKSHWKKVNRKKTTTPNDVSTAPASFINRKVNF